MQKIQMYKDKISFGLLFLQYSVNSCNISIYIVNTEQYGVFKHVSIEASCSRKSCCCWAKRTFTKNGKRKEEYSWTWSTTGDTDDSLCISCHLHRSSFQQIWPGCLLYHACNSIKETLRELALLSVAVLLCRLHAHWPKSKGFAQKKVNPTSSPMPHIKASVRSSWSRMSVWEVAG